MSGTMSDVVKCTDRIPAFTTEVEATETIDNFIEYLIQRLYGGAYVANNRSTIRRVIVFKTLIKALIINAGDMPFTVRDAVQWWKRTASTTTRKHAGECSGIRTALMQLMQLGGGVVTRNYGTVPGQCAYIVYRFHLRELVTISIARKCLNELTGSN